MQLNWDLAATSGGAEGVPVSGSLVRGETANGNVGANSSRADGGVFDDDQVDGGLSDSTKVKGADQE